MDSVSASPPFIITLESVQSQFAHWRATRSKPGKIPEVLWEAVRQLTKHYKQSEIMKALGINYDQLRANLKKERTPESSPLLKGDFVEVPVPSLSALSPLPLLQEGASYAESAIELILSQGTTLKVRGLRYKDVVALIEGCLKA